MLEEKSFGGRAEPVAMEKRLLRCILVLILISIFLFSKHYPYEPDEYNWDMMAQLVDQNFSQGNNGDVDSISNYRFNRVKAMGRKYLDQRHTKKVSKPVRIPLAGFLYEHGHQDNEIDVARICPQKGLYIDLLVLITSTLNHYAARMAIRQTWMHYASRRNIAMAFVLGRDNELENKSLREENLMYGDMIRGHFIDSYANLTLKTISSLEWVCRHCPRMKYLLKTDDDMFINVPKLLTLLGTLTDNRTIYGRKVGNWKPVRNRWSKYYVSTAQFAGDTFPFFTTGPAYILPRNIVYALYKRSLATPYLKLEDVFTTGIVAESLGIWRVHVREMANTRTKLETCRIRSRVSVHMVQPHEQLDLWKKQLDDTIKC